MQKLANCLGIASRSKMPWCSQHFLRAPPTHNLRSVYAIVVWLGNCVAKNTRTCFWTCSICPTTQLFEHNCANLCYTGESKQTILSIKRAQSLCMKRIMVPVCDDAPGAPIVPASGVAKKVEHKQNDSGRSNDVSICVKPSVVAIQDNATLPHDTFCRGNNFLFGKWSAIRVAVARRRATTRCSQSWVAFCLV